MDKLKYPIVETFLSIQGEGARAGTLNHFIRLAGCNLRCPFCDTNFDTPSEHLSSDELVDRLNKTSPCKSVVITGGEPFIHDLRPLVESLKISGYYVAVETNGSLLGSEATQDFSYPIDWITVSPKTRIPHDILLFWASEVKYVIPDSERLVSWGINNIFLQPEWGKGEASVKRCMELIEQHPNARLSVQIHKFINVR